MACPFHLHTHALWCLLQFVCRILLLNSKGDDVHQWEYRTTKSFVANHLAESVAGAMTTRAFEEEDRLFAKNLELIDGNASPYFHNFAANEWLIQRLETLCVTVLSSAALCMVLLPPGTFSSGFIGMAVSHGLSLNVSCYVNSEPMQIANYIISVERLNQYIDIPSEAPLVIEDNQPPGPTVGKVEIQNLLVLGKCQLRDAIQEKEGLDAMVAEDGSNWSMEERQLFCLGRAFLRRSRILVLDEAAASTVNSTDLILQKTIRTKFADCTVITVDHRIPTVMYCTMVLAIREGELAEYNEPMKLMKREDSLFGQLVKEYWSHCS